MRAERARMEHLILAALIGQGSGMTHDGDTTTQGHGGAVQLEAAYRVRELSIGAVLGRITWTGSASDYEGSYSEREQLTDIAARGAVHAGPCFFGLGVGTEAYRWGDLSARSPDLRLYMVELGCSFEHIDVSFMHTSADNDKTTTDSNRFLLGFAF